VAAEAFETPCSLTEKKRSSGLHVLKDFAPPNEFINEDFPIFVTWSEVRAVLTSSRYGSGQENF
jgi:hypothetical protein